jgi:hypothetical protein
MTRELLVLAKGNPSRERAVWKKHCDSETSDGTATYTLNHF